ncbi:PASTA domain-containing protein [Nonomuraea sp. NPDC046570]|uniref:PASTA domain-containing protein n=1 Tax=Nonomuraea sp. NPDC046570 TaxID=3155255 RepID=UPI00340399EC
MRHFPVVLAGAAAVFVAAIAMTVYALLPDADAVPTRLELVAAPDGGSPSPSPTFLTLPPVASVPGPAPVTQTPTLSASDVFRHVLPPSYGAQVMPELWNMDGKSALALMAEMGFDAEILNRPSVAKPEDWIVAGQSPGPGDSLLKTMRVLVHLVPKDPRDAPPLVEPSMTHTPIPFVPPHTPSPG